MLGRLCSLLFGSFSPTCSHRTVSCSHLSLDTPCLPPLQGSRKRREREEDTRLCSLAALVLLSLSIVTASLAKLMGLSWPLCGRCWNTSEMGTCLGPGGGNGRSPYTLHSAEGSKFPTLPLPCPLMWPRVALRWFCGTSSALLSNPSWAI